MKCPQPDCLTPLEPGTPRCRCGATLHWQGKHLARTYVDGRVTYQRRRNCDTAWEDGWSDASPQIRPHGIRYYGRRGQLGVATTLGGTP